MRINNMTYHLSVFLILSAVLTTSTAFVVFSVGECPDISPIPNYNLTKYLGRWYNYENFDAPFQLSLSCVTATYDLMSDSEISVLNEGYMDISVFNRILYRRPESAIGRARIVDPDVPSKLYVSFGNQPDFGIYDGPRPNYQIVDTDYDNYSLVYSCTQLPYVPVKLESAWILSRFRASRPAKTDALKAMLTSFGVEVKNFKIVDQNQC